MPTGSTLTLPLPRGFDLPRVVCSYGYFTLAPNEWAPATQSFTRPLRLDARRAPVTVNVSQTNTRPDRLRVQCDQRLTAPQQKQVKRAVARMLRLDEDLTQWFKQNPAAARAAFGRLFRSPTLFEDIVKTITGCNVAWPNTIRMNRLLCQHIGRGAFPAPHQLARCQPKQLKQKTKVGYRAQRIIRLARDVEAGQLDLDWFEHPHRTSDEAFAALRRIHGLGPYAAANICQHLGFYDQLAIDSETYRHFRHHFNIANTVTDRQLHPRILAHYQQYHPYQFLAYWHELWRDYERKLGPATQWDHHAATAVTR